MSGVAVIDVETTGLGRTDRVVEVAVVLLADRGSREDVFTTLVNPGRDVGGGEIHGLCATDLAHAPRFHEVAPHLAHLLSGRMLVAHNVWFDLSLISREFERAGILWPAITHGACTMRAATEYMGTPASLGMACAYLSVDLEANHSAQADALAAAELFRLFAWDTPWQSGLPGLGEFHWDRVEDVGRFLGSAATVEEWVTRAADPWPLLEGVRRESVTACTRSVAAARRQEADHRVGRWISRIPEVSCGGVVSAEYMDLVQQALLDRQVTETELEGLAELAEALGLTAGDIVEMHREVLRHVAAAALADGIVSSDERSDLERVALLLGLGADDVEVSLALGSTTDGLGGLLAPGDCVTFTGQMSVERGELEALALSVGLSTSSLTKKTTVLVAADPNSESGKAKKAKQYGVPVIAEQTFRYEVDRLAVVG